MLCIGIALRNHNGFCDLRLRCPSRTRFRRQDTAMLYWGGDGPDHLLVVPPGKRPRGTLERCLASFFRLRLVCGCVCSCFSLSLYFVSKFTVCFSVRPAKRRARNLQGTSLLYVYVSFCYLGGGSLDGGNLVFPRCLGPSRLTSEGRGAAHGPRHPA